MQVAEIKSYLKKNKITYDTLSENSGIPIGTIKSIFSGRTPNPRLDTIQAIEAALGLNKPLDWSDEDYANGVTDNARIEVSTREYEWLELGNKVLRTKGEEYYNMLVKMIEGML